MKVEESKKQAADLQEVSSLLFFSRYQTLRVPVPHVSFSRFIVVRFFSDQIALLQGFAYERLHQGAALLGAYLLHEVLSESVRREAAKVRKKEEKNVESCCGNLLNYLYLCHVILMILHVLKKNAYEKTYINSSCRRYDDYGKCTRDSI